MNFNPTLPIAERDREDAIQNALVADETALFGTGAGSSCDVKTAALTAPTGVTVTVQGTAGSTNNSYVVAALGNGGTFAPAAAVQVTTANATLSTTNFNRITWVSVPGYTYRIFRSEAAGTPNTTGLIGTVVATGYSSTFDDTAKAATAAVIPTANTTGAVSAAGPAFGAPTFNVVTVPTLNNASNQTLTPAHILNGVLIRTGSSTPTDTLPTAAILVAAIPGARVGTAFRFVYRNRGSGTATLAAGTGGTSATGNTLTVPTVNSKEFMVVLTNVTAGAEAYDLYVLGAASAH